MSNWLALDLEIEVAGGFGDFVFGVFCADKVCGGDGDPGGGEGVGDGAGVGVVDAVDEGFPWEVSTEVERVDDDFLDVSWGGLESRG